MRLRALAVILCFVLPASAAPKFQEKTVRIRTSDDWRLAGTFVSTAKPDPEKTAVVLLHGLGAGKNEWSGFQKALAEQGVSSVAIDLRGHGDSVRKGKIKVVYQQFADHGPDGEWMNLWKDGQAGVKFLQANGFKRIGIAGASVGANAAAFSAAKTPQVHFLVLLSAGMNYQGLQPADAIQAYGPRRLLLAASQGDGYAYNSGTFFRNLRYSARLPADWAETSQGHGVQMFQDRQFLDRIVRWIIEK